MDVLGSLQFLLETDGFEVQTFRSGAALLNAMIHREVDCFVIDYKMPAMSGIDLATRLRNRDIEAPDHSDFRLSGRKHRGKGRGGGHTPRAAQAASRGKPRKPHSGRHSEERGRRAINAAGDLR